MSLSAAPSHLVVVAPVLFCGLITYTNIFAMNCSTFSKLNLLPFFHPIFILTKLAHCPSADWFVTCSPSLEGVSMIRLFPVSILLNIPALLWFRTNFYFICISVCLLGSCYQTDLTCIHMYILFYVIFIFPDTTAMILDFKRILCYCICQD